MAATCAYPLPPFAGRAAHLAHSQVPQVLMQSSEAKARDELFASYLSADRPFLEDLPALAGAVVRSSARKAKAPAPAPSVTITTPAPAQKPVSLSTTGDLRSKKRKNAETAGLTPEQIKEWKKQRRKDKNREAAANSRARKKSYVQQLEDRLSDLSSENDRLKQQIIQLAQQNQSLQRQLRQEPTALPVFSEDFSTSSASTFSDSGSSPSSPSSFDDCETGSALDSDSDIVMSSASLPVAPVHSLCTPLESLPLPVSKPNPTPAVSAGPQLQVVSDNVSAPSLHSAVVSTSLPSRGVETCQATLPLVSSKPIGSRLVQTWPSSQSAQEPHSLTTKANPLMVQLSISLLWMIVLLSSSQTQRPQEQAPSQSTQPSRSPRPRRRSQSLRLPLSPSPLSLSQPIQPRSTQMGSFAPSLDSRIAAEASPSIHRASNHCRSPASVTSTSSRTSSSSSSSSRQDASAHRQQLPSLETVRRVLVNTRTFGYQFQIFANTYTQLCQGLLLMVYFSRFYRDSKL